MTRSRIAILGAVVLSSIVGFALDGMNLPTYAQSATISSTTTSDDVQVNQTITGVVKSVGPNSLTLNDDLVITIPAGTSIPAEVAVGVTITVTGQGPVASFVTVEI